MPGFVPVLPYQIVRIANQQLDELLQLGVSPLALATMPAKLAAIKALTAQVPPDMRAPLLMKIADIEVQLARARRQGTQRLIAAVAR